MEMWPLALPHGYYHDIIKSSVRSGVERFRVEEKKNERWRSRNGHRNINEFDREMGR